MKSRQIGHVFKNGKLCLVVWLISKDEVNIGCILFEASEVRQKSIDSVVIHYAFKKLVTKVIYHIYILIN